jgi:two-component system sensor histidine kinase/response regulator
VLQGVPGYDLSNREEVGLNTRSLNRATWDKTVLGVSISIIVMAVIVLVGWLAHIRTLVQIVAGLVPMQYSTALCFLALGAAGIGLSKRKRLLLLGGGSVAVLTGAAVILEYATGKSFGIETPFFYPWERSLSADPGRMALTTAFGFFLSGGALVILAMRRGSFAICGVVNSVTFSLALTSLVGYAFQITYVLPFNLGSEMALHTALAFFAYGIAVMGYAWKYAERGADGVPKWGAGIGVALLPVLLVAASALFPKQSWRVVPLEVLISIAGVTLVTLAVLRLKTAKVAYKGLLMIAIPLILLLMFVGLSVHVKHQSETAQVWTLHRKEVVGISVSLLARMTEAESAVRGYVITGDGAFLGSYRRSLESVTQTTKQLQDLVSDNPLQQTSAEKIEGLAAQRIDYLSNIVRLIETRDKNQAEAEIKGARGVELMKQVSEEIEWFSQEEDRLDADARQILDTSWQKLSWLLVAGTAGALLLASILTVLFSEGISKRLQRLRDNAISLAAGRDLAAPLTGNDEIAQLDRVFHEMAESLDEATRREKAVIEGTTDGIFVRDLEHRYLMINQAGADLLGKTVEAIIGTTAHDVFAPETARRILDRDAEILASGEMTTYELKATTKAGAERTYLTTRGPYRDRRGNVVGMIGINRDITERKRAEEALRASETRFQNAFDHAPTGIALEAPSGRFLQVNKCLCDMLGYTKEELLTLDFQSITHPDDLVVSQDLLRQLVAGEFTTIQLEKRYLHKLGHEVFALTHLSLVQDADAKPLYLIAQMQDITERKRAEAERQVIADIVQGVFTTAGLDELFDLVHLSIGKVLSAENCFIALYDKTSHLLHIPFCKDEFDQVAAPQRLGKGLTAFVLRTGRPMLLTAALVQELASKGEIELVGTLPAAWLGVPLRTSNETIGVLVVQHYKDKDAYSEQDLEMLASVGDQIGLAIERKRAEEALIESDRRFRDLFYDAPVGYHELDIEGRITCVNTTELVMLGYSSEEMIGHHVWEFIEEAEIARATFAEKLTGNKPLRNVERRFLRKDGTFMDVQLDDQMLHDPSGEIIGIRATMQDIVDRRRTEEALIQSEQRFRDLFENASDVIYTADFSGNFTSLNRSGERMTGYSREEALHLNFSQVVSAETLKVVQEMTARKIESNNETVYELEFFKKDGQPLQVEVSSRAIYKNGKPVGIQGIGRDITQRKQVEAELKLARDAALESVRLKADFLANMSHEIRTPMNGVIGMTDLLRDTNLTDEQRGYADAISVSGEALLTIINDILDFSKVEAGLLRFETIDFELHDVVEGATELLAERAQEKGLELASLVHHDVPTALQGDPGRLRQVLTNLAGNAVKFTERGDVVVTVKKVCETASHVMLRFEIQDTGIGISEEAQARLFHAFIQADGSTTRKYGGTGLGLAISKQLVELMGGDIGIDSKVGAGSTFWFTAEFEKQIAPAATASKTTAGLSGVRVLIVDDNATNRRILNHQTSSWGMIATEAESGERALELLRAGAKQGQACDIAILDLMMPDMDGFQLAEVIKADPLIAAVALVLLPSFGERGHGARARLAGISAYLQKPVRQSRLYDCLTAVMTRSVGDAPIISPSLFTRHSMRQLEAAQEDKAFSDMRIMIAEDNVVNQKVALGQLHKLGYRAEAVSNGQELLKALENAEVDLILMDCQMPLMDGFAATAEIRRREGAARHTTIIALTANALEGDDEKCFAAGMDDYLSKPVKADALRRKLERWTRPAKTAFYEHSLGVEELSGASDIAANTRGDVIDHAQIATLRSFQEPEQADFVTELIDLFVEETISQLKTLHQAVSRNDVPSVRMVAHLLKGSSASIGASQLAALYEKLEVNAGPDGEAAALLDQLDQEFELVREALKAERLDESPVGPCLEVAGD